MVYRPHVCGIAHTAEITVLGGLRAGAQGGSRTLKTLILSQVPMPIRLLGHERAQGVATRPRDMNSPTLTALTEVRAVYL